MAFEVQRKSQAALTREKEPKHVRTL